MCIILIEGNWCVPLTRPHQLLKGLDQLSDFWSPQVVRDYRIRGRSVRYALKIEPGRSSSRFSSNTITLCRM